MSQLLIKSQDIRYTKLTFVVQFTEDTMLPKQKVSAIRGGIGEMLLRANCVRGRECEKCDFLDECIVQRIMYSKYEKKPSFVTTVTMRYKPERALTPSLHLFYTSCLNHRNNEV